MKVITGARGSGRTTKLKEWAMQDPANRMIVLPYYHDHRYGWDDFMRLGGKVVDEVQAPVYARGNDRLVGVDDVQTFLSRFLAVDLDRLAVVTLPGELVDLDIRRMHLELQEIRSSCQ